MASLVVRAQAPADGLVAYYPLDGNAADASGNHLDGTAFATASISDRAGHPNSALQFDGATSYIDCGNPAQFNFAGSFTLAAWVKLTAGNQINKYVVAKYDFGHSLHDYGMGTAGNSQPYGFVLGDGPGFVDIPGAGNMNDSRWHAIAFVYDVASGLTLYLDGVEVGSRTAAGLPPFTNSAPLMIGRTFSGQFFAGAIDDVRIYNRALSASEISQLGPPPILVFAQQPQSYYSAVGATLTLRAVANASGTSAPVLYQWFKNDQPLAKATNSTLAVTGTAATEDIYTVKASAGSTSITSNPARITFALPADAGLLAHYTFDDDNGAIVVDATGFFPGQSVAAQYGPGRIGARAMKFDGASTYVRIPYPDSALDLAATPYTLAWWMKVDPAKTSTSTVVWMGDTADNYGGYGFAFTPSAFTWTHNSGADPAINAAFRPGTNWTHVALVWNGTARELFINGSRSNSFSTVNAIVSERDDDLFLGARNGSDNFFRGSLDDVRIYNYALASDEIAQLSSASVTIPLDITARANDLLLSWPFIDSSYTFRVESTTAIGPGANWTPLSGVPVRNGDLYSIAQPIPSTPRYYRLRKL